MDRDALVEIYVAAPLNPFSRHATSDEIAAHQSADSKCDVVAKIVDTFGEPTLNRGVRI